MVSTFRQTMTSRFDFMKSTNVKAMLISQQTPGTTLNLL